VNRLTRAIEAAISNAGRQLPEAARCDAVLNALEALESVWSQRAAMAADNQIEAARKDKHD